MNDRGGPRAHTRDGGLQARVDESLGRASPDRPSHRLAVEAVHDRTQVGPARRNAELGDVGDPQLVGAIRVEITSDQVLGRSRDLVFVGVVASAPPPGISRPQAS